SARRRSGSPRSRTWTPKSSSRPGRPVFSSGDSAALLRQTSRPWSISSTGCRASASTSPPSPSWTSIRCWHFRTAASRSMPACASHDRRSPHEPRPGSDREPARRIERMSRISAPEIAALDRYWRAANYLSVGQIYLLDNPLLREPLLREHVKPRLLGHFGTTPGLNLMYVHLNRAIRERELNSIFITGPGHGGPADVAPASPDRKDTAIHAQIGQSS